MNASEIDHIHARRKALEARSKCARLDYADLEEEIKQKQAQLALLQRNLDAMYGGLQELDALLAELGQEQPHDHP